jgi:UDP-N-acetylmuramoyl-L-alanyl-D-glutamate--2,6-diaminopimelate ligase
MVKSAVDFSIIMQELSAAGLNPVLLRQPKAEIFISGITADARKLSLNLGFCAIAGSAYDGHDYLLSSKDPVSIAIIERDDLPLDSVNGSAIIRVSSSRAAWAQLASFFCDHPANKMKMIGITGTNGKTSTTWMMRLIMESLGISCAGIGTLGIQSKNLKIETFHTTPDPDVLYPALQQLVESGVQVVIMEVSSHALVQGKMWPIRFDSAGFTSFSQDHLDFHKTIDDYLEAKLLLFEKFLKPKHPGLINIALLNLKKIRKLLDNNDHISTYGITRRGDADYSINTELMRVTGTIRVFIQNNTDFTSGEIPMTAPFFAENFGLAVALTRETLKIPLSNVLSSSINYQQLAVPGRLELVRDTRLPWRPLVYIDYAHTPDALEKTLNSLTVTDCQLSVVFGCGGDRDKTKRPLMGQIAQNLAHKVFITNDNPRTEDPNSIIADIVTGIDSNEGETATRHMPYKIELDRKVAIAAAVNDAQGRDVVLIAGKGHEEYQILGTDKLPFSDRAAAQEALQLPRTWLVFGMGISGLSAARHLLRFGDKVLLSDDNIFEVPADLQGCATVYTLDNIPWNIISAVIVSPGVNSSHPVFKQASSKGRAIISEIDLGLDQYRGKILAITGTNGKSTTVAMAEFIANNSGLKLQACGNIGRPPSDLDLRLANSDEAIALEISSYQLEGSQNWPSDGVAITSFSPDHLARHKTINSYFETKWRISKWLKPTGVFVLTTEVADFAINAGVIWPNGRIIVVGSGGERPMIPVDFEYIEIRNQKFVMRSEQFDFRDYKIVGHHNQSNALIASLLLQALAGHGITDSLKILGGFSGLPFRCQTSYKDHQIHIINDSKSTNLESTLGALTMSSNPVILLMGGQGKGESYEALHNHKEKIHTLITFGAASRTIASYAENKISTEIYEKMKEAVLRSLTLARDNGVDVLFSPGCASFDEFKNFEERGLEFDRLVKNEMDAAY